MATNIQQAIGIHGTFIMEIKLQQNIFDWNLTIFFSNLCLYFEPLLGWERAFVCHDQRTDKEGICDK